MYATNVLHVTDTIATSGQPTETDFKMMADQGYHTVINLALATSDYALTREGDIVTGLGMSYVHLPMLWVSPTEAQFQLFVAMMEQQQGKKVWVHCVMNKRVSVMVYLYRTLCLKVPESEAVQPLKAVWEPNAVWKQFIATVQEAHRGSR